jgi:hypothetical protein
MYNMHYFAQANLFHYRALSERCYGLNLIMGVGDEMGSPFKVVPSLAINVPPAPGISFLNLRQAGVGNTCVYIILLYHSLFSFILLEGATT